MPEETILKPTTSKTTTGTTTSRETLQPAPAAREPLQRVGDPAVITHDGVVGIFTPLTKKPGETDEQLSKLNEQILISRLQDEVVALREENAVLGAKLRAPDIPPRSAEDFASAMQRSLDQMQTRLSAMTNPVCNFAVKEFRIETNVSIDVTPLGAIEYRFIGPQHEVDPTRVSKIVVDLVPLPKQNAAGSLPPQLFKTEESLSAIRDIEPAILERLRSNHIYTAADLFQVGTRARATAELSSMLNIDRERLARWISLSELLMVRGIDSRAAEVLASLGVNNLADLSTAEPEDLARRFNEKLKESQRTDHQPVTATETKAWIAAARQFCGTKAQQAAAQAEQK